MQIFSQVCQSTSFYVQQRKQINMTDDDVEEAMGDMDYDETMEDLKNRQGVKQKIQDTASRQETELKEVLPKMIVRFKELFKIAEKKEKDPKEKERRVKMNKMWAEEAKRAAVEAKKKNEELKKRVAEAEAKKKKEEEAKKKEEGEKEKDGEDKKDEDEDEKKDDKKEETKEEKVEVENKFEVETKKDEKESPTPPAAPTPPVAPEPPSKCLERWIGTLEEIEGNVGKKVLFTTLNSREEQPVTQEEIDTKKKQNEMIEKDLVKAEEQRKEKEKGEGK
jgi:hypothetical protein